MVNIFEQSVYYIFSDFEGGYYRHGKKGVGNGVGGDFLFNILKNKHLWQMVSVSAE